MRPVRALAIAVALAATAIVALPASSPATALCEWPEYSCDDIYPAKSVIEGTLSSGTLASFATLVGTVQCKESTLKGETLSAEAEPLTGTISALEFGSCSLSGKSCTVTTENRPYNAKLTYSSGNGAFSVSGEKTLTAKLKCEALSCTVTGTPGGTLESGEAAKLAFNKASLKAEGLCGNPTFTATYALKSPGSGKVYVSQRGPQTTRLCTAVPVEMANELKCPAGNEYAAQIVKGQLAAGVAEFTDASDPTKQATCNESKYEGKFLENGKPVFNTGITSWTFGQKVGVETGKPCPSSFAGNPTVVVTVLNLPYSLSKIRYEGKTNPQGELDVRASAPTSPVKIRMEVFNNFPPDTCYYQTVRVLSNWLNGAGLNPTLLNPLTSLWNKLSGGAEICPAQLATSGVYTVNTGANTNLYVATP